MLCKVAEDIGKDKSYSLDKATSCKLFRLMSFVILKTLQKITFLRISTVLMEIRSKPYHPFLNPNRFTN